MYINQSNNTLKNKDKLYKKMNCIQFIHINMQV